MSQHDFDLLLNKYIAGQCDEQEQKLIMEWYEKQKNYSDTHPELLFPSEKKEIEDRIWLKIRQNTDKTPFGRRGLIGLVASVLVIASVGYFWYANQGKNLPFQASISKGMEVKNTSYSTQEITLEDGSLVELAPQSMISYPEHFGNYSREVHIKGEAFFSVKKDPTKPFIVHSKGLTTEVLGTRFRVNAFESQKNIEVQVSSGRVSVFENGEENNKSQKGIILSPNQQARFNKETKKLAVSIVKNPQIINPVGSRKELIFEDTPFKTVINKMKHLYGLELVLENKNINKCKITGDFNDLSFDIQLELLCKAINARHEQRGTSIFIQGEGCK